MTERKANKKRRGNVGRTILLVIISVVIGLSVYTWNAMTLTGNKMPMPFGYGEAVVLSGSMEPTLSVDDLVFIKSCESYEPGDVVIYQSGGSLVIHRIVSIDGETVVTKGDANNREDDPFPVTAIKGKMVGKLSGVGRLSSMIKSPAGIIVILGAAVLLLILSYRKERETDEEDTEKMIEEIKKLKEELYPSNGGEKNEGTKE